MAFAAKSIENMTAEKGCTSCHQPDSENSFKNKIKSMADDGRHSDVTKMISNEGPERCRSCHEFNAESGEIN